LDEEDEEQEDEDEDEPPFDCLVVGLVLVVLSLFWLSFGVMMEPLFVEPTLATVNSSYSPCK
jgi:hypothetical protein